MGADEVRQLSAWLAATDIDLLELDGPGERLCLRRDGAKFAVVADAAAHDECGPPAVVAADSVGLFLHAHPQRAEPLAVPGGQVRAGQVLGLLHIGALLLPVTAPQDGVVLSILVAPGAAVGYGTPLLELRPA